jgi:alcohol dehydrogenase YqhD (iron-dependent ADH family)
MHNKNNKTQSLGRSYRKTILTIKSCKTKKQLEVASRMVENFKKFYKKVGYPKSLSYNLDREIKIKYNLLESLSKNK